jgi:K+-transporting ATPase ATPase B chain
MKTAFSEEIRPMHRAGRGARWRRSLSRVFFLLRPLGRGRRLVGFAVALAATLVLLGTLVALFAGLNRIVLAYLIPLELLLGASLFFSLYAARRRDGTAPNRGSPSAIHRSLNDHELLIGVRGTAQFLQTPAASDQQPDLEPTAASVRPGSLLTLRPGQLIPEDGVIVEGSAFVDESAFTGESPPVLREAGGENAAVLRGTRVLSGQILVRVSADRG